MAAMPPRSDFENICRFDSAREATSDEAKGLRAETHQLKEPRPRDDGGPPAEKKDREVDISGNCESEP
jgi:hypothetical protein